MSTRTDSSFISCADAGAVAKMADNSATAGARILADFSGASANAILEIPIIRISIGPCSAIRWMLEDEVIAVAEAQLAGDWSRHSRQHSHRSLPLSPGRDNALIWALVRLQ